MLELVQIYYERHTMEQCIIVVITVPNEAVAKNISLQLIKQKLCACVNIIPKCLSVYEWNGKIKETSEQILIIKTSENKYIALEKMIKNIHPYEIPEILKFLIDGGELNYLNWIKSCLK